MKKIVLSLLLVLMLLCAAHAEEAAVATVNGEALPYSEYASIESAYLYQYEMSGADLSDPTAYTYVQDLALTYAVEQMLVKQDMRAQGCFDLDEETETWCQETGKEAYQTSLKDVMESMRTAESTDDELMVYALAYAESLGVSEETYVDFYRTQFAAVNYHSWLIRDNPVTDEDVDSAYAQRVESSKALYEHDAAAFETAVSSGAEVWYYPAGYRNVLQILLPAEGDTEAEKLAYTLDTVAEIVARLEKGEAFEALIREYGTDANFNDESFFSVGYQVHRDSVIWEDAFIAAAFSEDMAQPGCWSQPFASNLGVHILYYLSDAEAGAIEMDETLRDALSTLIYTERYTEAQAVRLDELAAAAEIVFH